MYKYSDGYCSEFQQVDCRDKNRGRNKLTYQCGCWRLKTMSVDHYQGYSPIELKSEGSCKINYYCL